MFSGCRCFLRPDNYFIWAFITPVVLIFIINVCFLVMAAKIMWNQQRKREIKKKSHKVLGWLKALLSLTVVMGLTWIIGLLVVEVEELAPLAYLYTIAVSFQGFFIFVVLVVIQKSVREDIQLFFQSNIKKIKKSFGLYLNSSEAVSIFV